MLFKYPALLATFASNSFTIEIKLCFVLCSDILLILNHGPTHYYFHRFSIGLGISTRGHFWWKPTCFLPYMSEVSEIRLLNWFNDFHVAILASPYIVVRIKAQVMWLSHSLSVFTLLFNAVLDVGTQRCLAFNKKSKLFNMQVLLILHSGLSKIHFKSEDIIFAITLVLIFSGECL